MPARPANAARWPSPARLDRIEAWTADPNPWLRRAALVVTLPGQADPIPTRPGARRASGSWMGGTRSRIAAGSRRRRSAGGCAACRCTIPTGSRPFSRARAPKRPSPAARPASDALTAGLFLGAANHPHRSASIERTSRSRVAVQSVAESVLGAGAERAPDVEFQQHRRQRLGRITMARSATAFCRPSTSRSRRRWRPAGATFPRARSPSPTAARRAGADSRQAVQILRRGPHALAQGPYQLVVQESRPPSCPAQSEAGHTGSVGAPASPRLGSRDRGRGSGG